MECINVKRLCKSLSSNKNLKDTLQDKVVNYHNHVLSITSLVLLLIRTIVYKLDKVKLCCK